MNELDELMDRYEKQFGEMIPLRIIHMNEEQLKTVLLSCLDTGKAYELPDEVKKLLADSEVQF